MIALGLVESLSASARIIRAIGSGNQIIHPHPWNFPLRHEDNISLPINTGNVESGIAQSVQDRSPNVKGNKKAATRCARRRSASIEKFRQKIKIKTEMIHPSGLRTPTRVPFGAFVDYGS